MRAFAFLVAMLAFRTVAAAPIAMSMHWSEGEFSRDMSVWTTDIKVTGHRIHYEASYSGRNSGMPGTKPVKVDGVIAHPDQLAAALAALDAAADPPTRPDDREAEGYGSEGCITRGKATRCASHGTEKPSAAYEAMVAVRAAAIDGLKIPPPL